MKRGVIDKVREAGGEVFGITSEPHTLASEAVEAWDLNFPIMAFITRYVKPAHNRVGWIFF